MATKTTGAELKRFYADKEFWPDEADYYHEDEWLVVNGVEPKDFETVNIDDLADTDEIKLSGGQVCNAPGEPSFETYFKRWRKKQSIATLFVEVPKDRAEEFAALIRNAGGKVTT